MNHYQHLWQDGSPGRFPTGKVVCIGRNYSDHAAELNNPVPDTPLLFIKPATAVVHLTQPIVIPKNRGEVHFETELAILIGQRLTSTTEENARNAIVGYGLGLDLTLRDLQSELKAQGHPWERAKAFDGACPLSPFVRAQALDAEHLHFSLDIDGKRRQSGDTSALLNPVLPLISYISEQFTLMPGDVVLTGTPKGVGPLHSGQRLTVRLQDVLCINTEIA
ncbi:MAG: fumarylacetoacetate hydrolase family protein [Oleiphilaceae bacterium]|nr:fumarylacetoacetate hydrolase family protein [Oleiphilaceae bacterium]